MLDGLFTSKMRVQILMRLFLNPDSQAYLRELSGEFRASPGHVKSELSQLSAADLLRSSRRGRQVYYSANSSHPLFPELQSMVRKALGMDRIIESIVERLGNLEAAYLTGDYAEGRDTGIIDLLLVGDINRMNLDDLVTKTERFIQRRIRTLVLSKEEMSDPDMLDQLQPRLLLWLKLVEGEQQNKGKVDVA